MDLVHGASFLVDAPDAYETLILDALRGDATLFTRQDEVEEQWRLVDPSSPRAIELRTSATAADGSVRPPFERGMAEGDVAGIRVEGEQGGVRSEFRIHGDGRRHAALTVRQDGRVTAERIVPPPPTDVVALLGEELTILAADRVYEDALGVLLTLS